MVFLGRKVSVRVRYSRLSRPGTAGSVGRSSILSKKLYGLGELELLSLTTMPPVTISDLAKMVTRTTEGLI